MYVSGSINEALHYVNGDYILICADDVVVERDTIENLVKCLSSHKHIGIICPLCYYLRRPDRIWWAGSKIDLLTSRTYKYGIDLPLPNSDIFETDSFTTIALIRRELFYDNGKLYFVDPKEFPIHNEEADFSFRARLKGWRVCVTKSAKAYHDISLPEEHNLARLFHVHTGSRAYYVARNRIIFQKKYSKLWQFLIFILFFNWLFAIYYLRIILLKSDKPLPERLKIAYSYCRGLLSGIKWVLTVR
jgi:GT2 family glycosyltransferase